MRFKQFLFALFTLTSLVCFGQNNVHIDRINGKAYMIFTNSFNQETQQGVRLFMRKLKKNYGS